MAHVTHKHCTVISRPRCKAETNQWLPYCTVVWRDRDGFHYHEFDDFGRKFDNEEDAIHFAFAIARAWINDAL
jgi:hypothetical protein